LEQYQQELEEAKTALPQVKETLAATTADFQAKEQKYNKKYQEWKTAQQMSDDSRQQNASQNSALAGLMPLKDSHNLGIYVCH
jgi:hypothetical protein